MNDDNVPVAPAAGTDAENVNPAIGELNDFLDLVNGTDAYNNTAIAVGKLDKSEYLRIPDTMDPSEFNPKAMGLADSAKHTDNLQFAQVYVLNKEIFGDNERAIKIGLVRAFAVSLGWYTGNYEVEKVPAPTNAQLTMANDIITVKRFAETARKVAILLPLAAEFVFRTMGHHYITGMGPDYEAKYQKFFNACVEPDLTSFLAPADMYHKALHWVSLKDALALVKDSDAAEWLPNAVVIRSTSAPAGTALVATSHAVVTAMEGTGLRSSLERYSGVDLDLLEAVTVQVTTNPGAYHTIPTAYNATPPTVDNQKKLQVAKANAIKLAPVLQGFLDALPNSSSLAQARALAKHADMNPLLRKRAKVFFKEVGTAKAGSMEELFAADKRTKAAKAEESIEDIDE